jgi:ABC-type glycerol-3-phosphate transport system permease component
MVAQAEQIRSIPREEETRFTFKLFIAYLFITAVALLLSGPMFYMLLASFKAETELTASLNPFPTVWRVQNYVDAVTLQSMFPRYVVNSLLLATATGLLNTFSSAMAGYAFARLAVPGRRSLFGLVRTMLMLPAMALTIPQYLLYARLGFIDTYWPWIVGGMTGSAYSIFLFRQFFLGFPKELEDAAEVDGAGGFRTFLQIFIPNSLPALATVFIFSWSGVWGNWLTPQLYLIHDEKQLIAARLSAYTDQYGNPLVAPRMAAAVLYALPLIIMFFLAQKYILKGVVTSGLKG